MAMDALNATGLAYVWTKLKTLLSAKADLVNGKVPSSQLPSGSGGSSTVVLGTSIDASDFGDVWGVSGAQGTGFMESLSSGTLSDAQTAVSAGELALLQIDLVSNNTTSGTIVLPLVHAENGTLFSAPYRNDLGQVLLAYVSSSGVTVEISEPQSGGGDSLPAVTTDDNGQVLKVSSGAWGKGSQSWNDLSDKPFYETVISQGYDYEIDLDDPNYIPGYINFSGQVQLPAKFYRVGDAMTQNQLIGAVSAINNVEGETSTATIASEYIEEIQNNGDTVGFLAASDMPMALVISENNVTIDFTPSSIYWGCSGTFANSGLYLFWADASALAGEGASAYAEEISKERETTVTPLPDKYYKAPFIVNCDLSLQTMQLSNFDKSFSEVEAEVNNGKTCAIAVNYINPSGFAEVTFAYVNIYQPNAYITFNVLMEADFGNGNALYNFMIRMGADDTKTLTVRQITSTLINS